VRAAALGDAEIRRGVHRFAVTQHLKIDMHAVGQAGVTDDPDLVPGSKVGFPHCQGRRHHAQVAVDADETIMLHQHFQATDTFALGAYHATRGDGTYGGAGRGRHVDAVVIDPGPGPVRQLARTEGRGNAGGRDRRQQRFGLRQRRQRAEQEGEPHHIHDADMAHGGGTSKQNMRYAAV
jgi:hypothetical protein